jgi:tetratricopeptide (TPR) repeat protein
VSGRRALAFPVGFTLLFAAGISAILVYGRYRLPLLVPLSLLAAAGLDRILRVARERRRLHLGAAAAALARLIYAPVLPGVPVDFVTDYSNHGNRFWDLGQHDRAFEEYEKALRVRPGVNPGVPRLYVGLGRIYIGRGELHRAEKLLREGAARYPADRDIPRLLEEVQRRTAARPPSP